MKYFLKKLLGREIFRSMVLWATKFFLKNLSNPPAPPLNVRSLKALFQSQMMKDKSTTLLAIRNQLF